MQMAQSEESLAQKPKHFSASDVHFRTPLMADRLGLEALAKGVETIEEQGALRDLGCPFAQGHVFATPMPVAECGNWIRDRQTGQTKGRSPLIRRVQ